MARPESVGCSSARRPDPIDAPPDESGGAFSFPFQEQSYARGDSGHLRLVQRSSGAAALAGPGDASLPRGQGRGRGGARRRGRGRLPPDRELADRIGHHHLRPARGGVRGRHAQAHARDPLPGPPHDHGGPWCPARRHQAGAVASRRARPVPHLALGAPAERRAGERLGHGGQRGDGGTGGESGARGDRRAARRGCPRARAARRADRGRSHQPDPIPHLHPCRCAGRCRRAAWG